MFSRNSRTFISGISLMSLSLQILFGFVGSTYAVTDTTPPSVTINTKLGQIDPTTSSPILYTVVFSEPIDVSTFTPSTLSTSGSTATGIVINSITEVAPNNGTTFDISMSASGTGKVVLSIPQGTGEVSTILGTTDAGPVGITIDGSGNVYTANYSSGNVSKITPAGVSTILGTTGAYPYGITIDGSGNVYTANYSSGNVSKITPGGITDLAGNYNTASTSTDNEVTISGTENIVDTTPPVVTLIGSSTLTLFSGSVYADSGAVWSDNIDGSGTALVGTYGATGSFQSSGSVNTTLTGTYTIEYLKVDAAGNSGTVSRTVNVVPIITLNTNITGTGTATISIGAIQPGTLVVTSGSTINTTSTNGSLTIPGTVDFTLSGSVWNGILYAPAVSTGSTLDIGDASVVSNLPQDTSTTNYSYTVLQTLMAGGTGGTSVIASGGVFTLSMKVNSPSVHAGDTLPIFRSTDAVTWAPNTPTSSCILDANLMCTFTTDHLSFFGFVRVTSALIASASTSTTGPGGGGGGSSPAMSDLIGLGIIGSPTGNTSSDTATMSVGQENGTNVGVGPVNSAPQNTSALNMFADDNQNTAIGNPITTNMDNNSMGLPPPTPVGTAYISTKNSLRVRATASLGSSVIAYLYRNDQIEILENAPYWSHIQYYTKDGRAHEGYILSIYTRAPTKIDMIRNSIISFADAEMDSTIPTGIINVAHSLNLRSGPSINSRIKTVLSPNTQVIILDAVGRWSEILTENFHGYVSSKYVRQSK